MTGYGLTEAGTVSASRLGDLFEDIAMTVGIACAEQELRVADDGELLVRGYNVMQGYLDDPVATAEAVDAEGWWRTGDLPASTSTAGCAWWAARRTCSSSAGSTPIRPRSKVSCSYTLLWRRWP